MTRPSEHQPPSSRPLDPFELWRQIYETNERAWNTVLERTVNNVGFAESSGKILETFLSAQKTVRDNMRQYLEQINLPTREDIARLGELIVSLEEKIDQLDDRLARLEAAGISTSDRGGPSASGGATSARSRAGGAPGGSPVSGGRSARASGGGSAASRSTRGAGGDSGASTGRAGGAASSGGSARAATGGGR